MKPTAKKTLSQGRSQSGLRDHNVRQILSLIRTQGQLPKAEIAKNLGLSAQAVTVITTELEEEGLIIKQRSQKGKVGKPIVPLSINPDGAFAIGLKVDRRNFELTLIDFVGNVRASLSENFAYPTVGALLAFVKRGIKAISVSLSAESKNRIKGLGIATPYQIWNWAEEAGAPQDVMHQWQNFDFENQLSALTHLPIYISNDDTAACSAELCFGNTQQYQHFLYMFIGPFIGGGLVLNQKIFSGKSGNAAAIGSIPLGLSSVASLSSSAPNRQLINQSSLFLLENRLKTQGIDTRILYFANSQWQGFDDILTNWIDTIADGLVYASLTATAILDLEAVIIDGAVPQAVKQRIVETVKQKYQSSDTRGLTQLEFCCGELGRQAQAIGSANLPLLAQYY
ncbi:ROK family transcriptional regulator [Catenovulum sp. 2E275]|uniref:ROK family transcriptional regulator n=1 Tax=Catenovulum sp. 2E275 TaxID=2980497 RepID=UPI0021D0B356|nr:ROK family transcriptional regulator [Catenovulum sp. 2E275]MCU4675709.1 ROK family transcriptional regulator [Catenovulum sp. 2E275]